MIAAAQGLSRAASMRMSCKHTLHGKAPLDTSVLLKGARRFLRGATSGDLSKVTLPGHPCAVGMEVLV